MTTPGEIIAASTVDTPPDWASLQREILCPLCDYNLRGLTEPRCPECGYQFTWAGLQEEIAYQHSWFFEHHRRRLLRSFLKTWAMGLLPRRFWARIQPTNPPVFRRILIYWLALAAMVGVVAFAIRVLPTIQQYRQAAIVRRNLLARFQVQPLSPWYAKQLAKYGSPQAAIDAVLPYRPIWRVRALQGYNHVYWEIGMDLVAVLFLWPWVTLLTMTIFRQSLRQARIRTIHLLRCVVYASDVAPLILLPATYVLAEQLAFWLRGIMIFRPSAVITFGMIFGTLCYRLTIAYRQYLHFPHAVATCVATQLIVALVMFYFLPWTF